MTVGAIQHDTDMCIQSSAFSSIYEPGAHSSFVDSDLQLERDRCGGPYMSHFVSRDGCGDFSGFDVSSVVTVGAEE